jgi:hypothetical protein
MSAHAGAPGLRRPQIATPMYSPRSPAGGRRPRSRARSGLRRRKAIVVAIVTLGAPALAATALAGIAATGAGDPAGMGTLAGSQGLRGTTTPVTVSPSPSADRAPDRHGQKEPHRVAPSPPKGHGGPTEPDRATHSPPHRGNPAPQGQPRPHTRAPSPPTTSPSYSTNPTGPGAPVSTDESSGSGSPTSTSGTDSSGGSGSGQYEGQSAYSGGG